jgi:alpha-D-xyloside xylohydrolase
MKQRAMFVCDMLDLDDPQASADVVWCAARPSAVRCEGDDAVLTVPFLAAKRRGMDLAPQEDRAPKEYQVRVRAYGEAVVRVTAGFGKAPLADTNPMLSFAPSMKPVGLSVEATPGGWVVRDPRGIRRFEISTADTPTRPWKEGESAAPQVDFAATAYPDGRTAVPFGTFDRFNPERYESLPLAVVERGGTPHRALFSLKASADERFAGTGERFAALNLAGRTLLLENTDAMGVNNRRAYKNVPFYVSSRPYGLFLHTSHHLRLSLADISTRAAQALVEEPLLDLFFIGGPTLERIVYHYRCITGFPPELPLWSYGTWMSRMSYFSAEEVRTVVDGMRQGDFPLDVIHLDTGWFAKDWVCEWRFSEKNFPNPAGFMKEMRDRGVRVTLWEMPYVGANNVHYDAARTHGYIVPLKSGSTTIAPDSSEQKFAGHLDFSNPATVEWYKSQLERLLKMGASAIKADFGEDIEATADYSGMPWAQLHNLYALLYQKATFEITKEVTGEGIVWARAGWAGCQRYPLHRSGDSACTWEGMAGSIRGGLHLGLSGFAFWSHDVPGFHGVPDFMNSWPSPELYVRWTQLGVFTSHLRYHGTTPREPYEYPHVADTVRKWLKLRYALIPYLLQEGRKASSSGMPVLRALVLHHQDDPTCWAIDDQFYCGEDLLVAPIMNDEGKRNVYLPQGEWVDLWTGEKIVGPAWRRDIAMPLERLPVYVRAGAKLPIYPRAVLSTSEMDLSKAEKLAIDDGFRGLGKSVLGPLTGFGASSRHLRV